MKIPFNKPFLTGKEMHYMYQAVYSGKISGNGMYTQYCQNFFEKNYAIKKALLTTSCTDALEMCAMLSNIEKGDEVIIPSYTFVSTALAFIRQGANVIFADSSDDHPCLDVDKIEALITERTKAIVPVHYAGVACDMDKIMRLANKYNLIVIEDAAQAIDSYYKGKPLGSIGHLAAFSFHETKNINAGEGGLLAINDEKFISRAEIIWEKGTNRAEFFRGEINKYGWVDIGSSFLPSEIVAAFLWAQLENISLIQNRRIEIWNNYKELFDKILPLNGYKLSSVPDYATNNGHMFFIICPNEKSRGRLIENLKENGIYSVFHYLSLHDSSYYKGKYKGKELINSDLYSNNLVRLPLFYELSDEEIGFIFRCVKEFIENEMVQVIK